jgi:HlyD family secretion protein
MSKTPEKKLSAEQIKQLQQLMAKQQGAGGMPTRPGTPKKFTPKWFFMHFLQTLQKNVKFIDQFIDFVVKKDSDKTNDVIKNARAPILFGVYVLFFFVFLGLIWTATAPLDSAAVAIGKVVSSTNRKTINHPDGGIIKKIYVQLGDQVKQGDKLIEFDDTRIKAEYETSLNQYRSYSAAEGRLLAEINGDSEIAYSEFLLKDKDLPEVTKIIETQNNLFQSKNKLQQAEVDSLKQRVLQSKKQIEGYRAKKLALAKTLDVTQDRLDANRKLSEKGYAHKATILELEAREANAESELAIIDTEIIKVEQEITRTEIELINVSNKTSTQALSELKDTQIRLAEVKERFFALQEHLKRIIITSPVDGVVNNLNYHTIGSSIPSSHTIMEISPSDDVLVIEAKIPPQNIDSVTVGLESKIRFSAFKSRTTPLFLGKVVSLSPDIIIEQGPMTDPKLAGGYYLARIELDMEQFEKLAKPRHLILHPGMQAEVQIITGTRTLLRYLLDPVIDAMFKGFKEK